MSTRNMKYLKVKNDVYISNRHIPKQFKEAFNATAINCSLKTDSYKEAIKARDQMNVWFDKKCRAEATNPLFFEKLKEYEGLTKEQASTLAAAAALQDAANQAQQTALEKFGTGKFGQSTFQ